MAYSVDEAHLTVPSANAAARGRHTAEHRDLGLRSRSPSPSSSRGTSPTLASIPLPSYPLVSGGPHSRPHNLAPLHANSSALSLNNVHHIRTHQSTSSLRTGSATSSRIDIRVKGPDSPDDDAASFGSSDIAAHAPDTATFNDKGDDDEDLRPVPITPLIMEDQKYSHRPILDGYAYVNSIPAGTIDFQSKEVIPPEWTRCVGPEGDVYYHNAKERLYTVSDITDEDVITWIDKWYPVLRQERSEHKLPDDTDLALCHEERGYYMVSWKTKAVYWTDDNVDVGLVTNNDRWVVSYPHLESKIRSQFWKHVQIFPNDYEFTQDCIDELHSILTFGHADVLSSESTTFPYDAELAGHALRIVDKLKPGLKGATNANYVSTLARYLDQLNAERFLHYHGDRHVRLNRMETAYPRKHMAAFSRFFKCISPLLFFQPNWYFQELQKVYVDGTVHYYAWRRFIGELKKDWENSLTPATVLLSANVGFLAIQSIDNTTDFRSAAQIASYTSALFSLFDYVVVLLLMRRHRMALYDTAERGLDFFKSREDTVGLQMLAICVSLPGALFVWSILTFLIALAYIFFHNSTSATIIVTALVMVVLSVMVVNLFIMDLFSDIIKPWANDRFSERTWFSMVTTHRLPQPWRRWSKGKANDPELPT